MARICVADDDVDIRHLLEFALTHEGHEVTAVENGELAVAAVVDAPPDILVLDVMMPKMTGLEALDELIRLGLRDTTKIVMLTAKTAERDWAEGFDRGADLYLTKPFDPDELFEAVRDLESLSHAELKERREAERSKAKLLAQLESLLG